MPRCCAAAGEGAVPRVQQRTLAHQLHDLSVAGEPVQQDPAGSHGVPGAGRFLTQA